MFAQLGLICNVSKVRINKLHILNIYPPCRDSTFHLRHAVNKQISEKVGFLVLNGKF